MRVKLTRATRRRLAEAGGSLTIEARSETGCWCAAHLDARPGPPADPEGFFAVDAGGIRVFIRGLLQCPDGAVRSSTSVIPRTIRVRHRHGRLSAAVG